MRSDSVGYRTLSDVEISKEDKMEEKILQHVEVLSGTTGDENILKSLRDLNILVDSRALSSDKILALIPPGLLFRRLSITQNTDVISHCSILLKKLLNYMKPEQIITEYEVEAMQGVNHPAVEVRELCLQQIERCVQTNGGVEKIIQNLDLMGFIIRNLAQSHVSCAKTAGAILVCISRHGEGLALVLRENTQSEFFELMKENDTICFRVFELFVKIFEVNQQSFERFKEIFNSLAAKINSDDILIQMNCIEMLTDLVIINEVAYRFPEETGVNQKLYEILLTIESNPLSTLLVPAILKYFGFLSMKNPHFVCLKYPHFFEFIFNCIVSNEDISLLPVAMDTVGAICLSNEGLVALFQSASRQNLMVGIGGYLRTADEKIRIHSLDCLASIFTRNDSLDMDTVALIHNLYKKIDSNPLPTLFQVLQKPFNNVRRSCYKLFYSLVNFSWMLADINNTAGFFEYLLDRGTESEKECQQLKYEVIRKILLSSDAANIFDKPSVLKMKQFVRDGPFYPGSDVSVAMEEA